MTKHPFPTALTIAGSDPSGGAGIQADLKVFHQFGVYGMSVLTLLTVQNTKKVSRVEPVSADLLCEQLESVLEDIPPGAAKSGALGSTEIVLTLAECASKFDFPLVVDPAAVSTQGQRLIEEAAIDALRAQLIPRSFLLTPNLAEASLLTGNKIKTVSEMQDAARTLQAMGAKNVLVKGGHLEDTATDVLLLESGAWHEFQAPMFATPHTHGTGCSLSAAITAGLAQGKNVFASVSIAKDYITEAIRTAPKLGGGNGPINHFVRPNAR